MVKVMVNADRIHSVKKRIAVVTGTRAEFGLLRPLLARLEKSSEKFDLSLIVTGTHLSRWHGHTIDEVKKETSCNIIKVPLLVDSSDSGAISRSVGLGVIGFTEAYERIAPQLVIVLGDRFEIVSASIAATVLRIPIGHIAGGDVTEGALDETFRHLVSKLAVLHFTTNEASSNRLLKLGENKTSIFTTGNMFLDSLSDLTLKTKESLELELGVDLSSKSVLVTFHPETRKAPELLAMDVQALLDALAKLEDTYIIFTQANADEGGDLINQEIGKFTKTFSNRSKLFPSLGQLRYLSLLSAVDCVIGNSSSGIYEAPSFGVPTINIGNRQKGREFASCIICCESNKDAILSSIEKAFSSDFVDSAKKVESPYGIGNAAEKIMNVLIEKDFSSLVIKKFFAD